MKVYALFLPQFHETKENNEWWGDGFTEWTNVKKAKPLFKKQIQPKSPLGDYYYNLLDKETVIWQTKLMHDYGIDAFIYYHYYFCGKKLLNLPAENLLSWKEINQPFFFNWANHSWNRSWNGSKEVLVEQVYGKEDDWFEHFNYLLQFFKDERYVKIDNMPVLMLYNTTFEEKEPMFSCFDRWCKENGFKGLYLIEECFNVNKQQLQLFDNDLCSITKNIYYTQPLVGRTLYTQKSIIRRYKDAILEKIIQRGLLKTVRRYNGDKLLINSMNERIKTGIPGVFFSWDNTPRHAYRGYVIDEVSKEVFEKYMDYYCDSEFMVINAWNEWCEGMMLEPTKDNHYKYLEWIKNWKDKTAG